MSGNESIGLELRAEIPSPVSVKLISLKSEAIISANMSIGEALGEGESGIVREAQIEIANGKKKRIYLAAIKTYRGQSEELEAGIPAEARMVEGHNYAYREQLVYYEALRRMGASVIPTFRLAQGENREILGIVMTNLEIRPLDGRSKVSKVSSTKTDIGGRRLTGKDLRLAKGIGLALEVDSWMLQYSSRWRGLGRLVPQAVIREIILR